MTYKEAGSLGIETGTIVVVMENAVRWVIAGIFIYSGSVKFMNPTRFAEIISGFGLLPDAFIYPFALLLPAIELVAVIGLVFGLPGSLQTIASLEE